MKITKAPKEKISIYRNRKPPYEIYANVCIGLVKTSNIARLEDAIDETDKAEILSHIIWDFYYGSKDATQTTA